MRLLWISLVFVLFFSSCQGKKAEEKAEVVISVYGKKLYKADLENIVYEGISYNDSVLRSKVYIDKWVRNQLLIRQAENNLTPEQLDFSKRLEEYRNSLVINKYETELINQNLDTEITEDQIYDYYNRNSAEFRLNRDIVQIASVSLPNDSKKKWIFTKLFRDYDSLMIDSLTSLAEKHAISYDFDIQEWHNFEDVIDTFNLKVKDGIVPLLVTNKHVVKGMKKGVFRFTTADENGNPKCTEHFIITYENSFEQTMLIFVCCQYYL